MLEMGQHLRVISTIFPLRYTPEGFPTREEKTLVFCVMTVSFSGRSLYKCNYHIYSLGTCFLIKSCGVKLYVPVYS